MRTFDTIYINGEWVKPQGTDRVELINPATEEVSGKAVRASAEDTRSAIAAARGAFDAFSRTSVDERVGMLEAIAAEYEKRSEEMADAITEDMGAPAKFSRSVHVPYGQGQFKTTAACLREISFESRVGKTLILREPIGVAALITPWNWPMLQTCGKIAAALAAGCTMVLKPAELATRSNVLMAEIIHSVGLPRGVFNMVLGRGSVIGDVLSSSPEVDYVSFTGSGPVGAAVGRNAADRAKKIALELGGKSPFIILPDADLEPTAKMAALGVMSNAGQTCGAATRTLVPAERKDEFVAAMKSVTEGLAVGDPKGKTFIGPVVSEDQWKSVQGYIQSGIDEGATLVMGGTGKPDGLDKGYYVKPTIFSDVTNDMKIAREEIFGPVASVISYKTVDEAIALANDSPFGLAAYVFGADHEKAAKVAREVQAGMVFVNTIQADLKAPWGGYKTSGVGREWGAWGIEEYLEVKSIPNYSRD